MKIRILAFGLAWTLCLYGQHQRFSWQESCFKNPGLPYCDGHDFAVKPNKDGKTPSAGTSPGTLPSMPSAVDAGGIDWRFADPSADALAVLKCSKLSASPLAHSLIDLLGANQGLSQPEVQNIFRGLSGVDQVALSLREDRIVLLVTGRTPDSILPVPEAGWKAVSLAGNAILIGHAGAVDQAVQRLSMASPLGELAGRALNRPADSEFWAVGSAKLGGPEAVTAGVKVFSVTASIRDRLASDTAFEFNGAPEAGAIRAWISTLADPKIEGNVVHVRMSKDADETRQSSGQIAVSPLGQRLGALIISARYLPVRDTAITVHTKPVIYGLDDGPREVKYVPSASDTSASVSRAQAVTDLSGTWAFTHAEARFQGTIVLRQTGSAITGTWHTSTGKSEPDSSLTGRVDGNTVTFTRFVGNNQSFVLTLSADGNRLDGFGDGWFLNHTNLNMQRSAATLLPSAPTPLPTTATTSEHLSFPPARDKYSWVIQSTLTPGAEIKYNSFYYETATDRSVEHPLTLPAGAAIVGVFPDDCTFSVKNDLGNSFTFRNEAEAKAKRLGPGTWSVYPLKCGSVAVFLK